MKRYNLLTDELKKAICLEYENGMNGVELSKKYCIPKNTIYYK
jgi:Mor family transcriptional regulator